MVNLPKAAWCPR